jgi:WD40 repeat protein
MFIATTGTQNQILVWNLETGQVETRLTRPYGGGKLLFSPRGELLAVQSAGPVDGPVVWDAATKPPRPLFTESRPDEGEQPNANLSFTPDGKTLVVSQLWSTEEREEQATPGVGRELRHFLSRWFSNLRGNWGELRLVDVASREVYGSYGRCEFWLLSPDGTQIATQSLDDNGRLEDIRLWAVPRRVPTALRLLYTMSVPALFFAAWWARRLAGSL